MEKKYNEVYLGSKEKVFIFVSGRSGSGKTYFSKLLNERIPNSIYFDSDMLETELFEHKSLKESFDIYNKEESNIIIFSDIEANKYFLPYEIKDSTIINILVKPISAEEGYKHYPLRELISFEDFKTYFSEDLILSKDANPIVVTNDYTDNLHQDVDRVLEEITERLNLPLTQNSKQKIKSLTPPKNHL